MLERRREATERDGCFDAGSARPNFTAARAVLLSSGLRISRLPLNNLPILPNRAQNPRLWQSFLSPLAVRLESCYDYEASTTRLPDSFVFRAYALRGTGVCVYCNGIDYRTFNIASCMISHPPEGASRGPPGTHLFQIADKRTCYAPASAFPGRPALGNAYFARKSVRDKRFAS